MILKIVLVTFISLVSNFMDTKEIALNVISNKELNEISILDEYENINNRTQIQLTSSNYIKGDIFPKYSLKTLEGKMIDNNSFKGKYILIDFWATWCIPCVKKRPVLEEINKKFGDKIEIISISLDSEISTVQNFRKEKYRMDWNHSIKPKMINDPLIKKLGIQSIPYSYLIDSSGKILSNGTELNSTRILTTIEKYLLQSE